MTKSKTEFRPIAACPIRPCWRPERKFTTQARRDAHVAQGEAHQAYATKHAESAKPSATDASTRGPAERRGARKLDAKRQEHGGITCGFAHPGAKHDAHIARVGTTAPVSVTPAPAQAVVAEAEAIVSETWQSRLNALAEATTLGYTQLSERITAVEQFVERMVGTQVA